MSFLKPGYARKIHKTCEIKETLSPFKLTNADYCSMMAKLNDNISRGLNEQTHNASSIKCFPTHLYELPTGQESGRYLAIDFGGTHFRVLLVHLGKERQFSMDFRTFVFPEDIMVGGTIEQVFDFLAECTESFSTEMNVANDNLPLGFCFAFPVNQTALDSGHVTQWTKRFKITDYQNKDIVQLLKLALANKNVKIDHIALLNDTTGCLLSCAWQDSRCNIGVIIGTGTNAAYLEKMEKIGTHKADRNHSHMIICTEWGNFGSDGSLDSVRTEFDRIVDANSLHPGIQIYEKMCSAMYMCELLRVCMIKTAEMGYMFNGEVSDMLRTPGTVSLEDINNIAKDDNELLQTMLVLENLGIKIVTRQDCANLRYMCKVICRRSAELISMGIATIINRMSISPITVGIDGGVYRYHAWYRDVLMDKIRCLINPDIQEWKKTTRKIQRNRKTLGKFNLSVVFFISSHAINMALLFRPAILYCILIRLIYFSTADDIDKGLRKPYETNVFNFLRLIIFRMVYGFASMFGLGDFLEEFAGGAFAPPSSDDYGGFDYDNDYKDYANYDY